jgi:hypothetical protein
MAEIKACFVSVICNNVSYLDVGAANRPSTTYADQGQEDVHNQELSRAKYADENKRRI